MSSIVRKALVCLRGKRHYDYPQLSFDVSDPVVVQQMIFDRLASDNPCMIARLGSVELQGVVDYLCQPSLMNAIRFIDGEIPAFGFAPSTQKTMNINAGFFPPTRKMLNAFGELMLSCLPQVDILGSWRKEENYISSYLSKAIRVPLYTLEPYYFDNPWTPVLEGKKVLVIHPFEDSIKRQHEIGIYDNLFVDKRLTPSYELHIIKAVQSIAGNKPSNFENWFDALDWMKKQIDIVDFDIAIIGCGAYGFPLAAYIKQIGKKAIHLGGAVQNLFGIRSLGSEKDKRFSKIMNSYWIRPSDTETPPNFRLVENGLYW